MISPTTSALVFDIGDRSKPGALLRHVANDLLGHEVNWSVSHGV